MTQMRRAHLSAPECGLISALVGVLMCLGATGAVGASDWTEREFAKFRLLPAVAAVAARREILIGLEIDLRPGWLFYSANPGEFGVAPKFDWAASRNLAKASVHWPTPARFHYSANPPISTLGYKGLVLLPVVLQPQTADAPLDVRLVLEYAVCEEFCIIDTVGLHVTLPAGPGKATRDRDRLRRALADATKTSR